LLADLEGERFLPYKVKYTGLEALRSDYPAVCQDALVECYSALLNEKGVKEVKKIINRFRTEFDCLPLDKITSSKSANNIPKFVDDNGNAVKGTPNHIKAAISYNKLIKHYNLDKLRPFNEGDKVQVTPLKRNPFGISEIAFDSKLPVELGLDKYVDRDSLFDKTFLSPLETICEVCGISKISQSNKTNSLF
jgi:DNA polymerase elongation subunit (family B)